MEGRLDPRWLLPIGWVWVNSHGSFPLGVVLLVVAAVGPAPGRTLAGPRARAASAGSCPACCSAPSARSGPGAPVPARAAQPPGAPRARSSSGGRRPSTRPASGCSSLQLVLAIVAARPPALVPVGAARRRVQRRGPAGRCATSPSPRSCMLPVMAAGLDRRRLAVVDRPAARGPARGAGCRGAWPLLLDGGPARPARPQPGSLPGRRAGLPGGDGHRHPGGPHGRRRLSSGNLVDYVYGPEQRTFYDDRFDMFPEDVSEAHLALVQGSPDASGPSSTDSTSTS